jgi:hypothetical protein
MPIPRPLLLAALCCCRLLATETENHGIRILPAPGPMTVDGSPADWDLSGGVFVCSDVENLRGRFATWFHLHWDKDGLYALARWTDDTPMNNPGSVAGDLGFQGDCLQVRVSIAAQGEPVFGGDEPATQRTSHLTAWSDHEGKDIIDLAWGARFDQGHLKDAKTQGARQAFARNADGKGYVQELFVPWTLLAPKGWSPVAGAAMRVTVEPNFGTAAKLRISTKDLFKAGVTPDRVFTFGNASVWGVGTLADHGAVPPAAVRLTDAREFPVRMAADGTPAIDWSGLYAEKRRDGFAAIPLTMPDDGYVSLNIRDAQGRVVRQLLTATWLAKGETTVRWDGLTNTSHLLPGEPVAAGAYTWDAIWHKGLGLRLVGWACNSGKAPFDSPGGNWGGDMGNPVAVTAAGDDVILGWAASEAGQAVVCTDTEGVVKWRHKRGGFGGAALVAADAGIVYVYDAGQGNTLYRLDQRHGTYSPWPGSDDAALAVATLLGKDRRVGADEQAFALAGAKLSGLDAGAGKLYLTFGERTSWGEAQPSANLVVIADAVTGKPLKTIAVPRPGDLELGPDGKAYVIANGAEVLRVDADAGTTSVAIAGLSNARALAIDRDGRFFVGVGDPDHQVRVFAADGTPLRTIGERGGRPLTGRWDRSGMRSIAGLRVDRRSQLWVMEDDHTPRRISVWNSADGAFVRELFGPTSYGAGGGAISPADPRMLVGHGCEWQIDPATGKAACIGVIDHREAGSARFGYGPGGRLYVALAGDQYRNGTVRIFERLAPGEWQLRTTIAATKPEGDDTGMIVWADANGDGLEQPSEVSTYAQPLGGWLNGWYMPLTQSLTFYGTAYRLAPVAWTACGAPVYDPTRSKRLPGPADAGQRGGMSARRGCGSEDGALMVYNGHYGADHSDFQCWNVGSGTLAWTYPNTYVGVHGGHNAPPPAVGLIRGAYDLVGSVKLPEPIGDVFVVATDKGEWHLLTGSGYYLSSLFQPDGLKVQWPDPCAPGAIMDNTPPGMGGEDFGGAITATRDGRLFVQAGKTAFIDLEVVGLEAVKKLGSGPLAVSAAEVQLAAGFRQRQLQGAAATRKLTVARATVAFTGDPRADFTGATAVTYAKNQSTATSVMAVDRTNLYVGWTVANDPTPWVNGATEPAVMYAKGDTVDLQLGLDAKADRARTQPVLGDLRLSIGDPLGKGAVAVLYRPLAERKRPRRFYSGTMKEGYEMQSVEVLGDVRIAVAVDKPGHRYVVEAAIPLADLGLAPVAGLSLSGDVGVTYGDPAGGDTVLRSHWSNQATDFVADEVWELVPEPQHWGTLSFE